jgi:hypothetical protein
MALEVAVEAAICSDGRRRWERQLPYCIFGSGAVGIENDIALSAEDAVVRVGMAFPSLDNRLNAPQRDVGPPMIQRLLPSRRQGHYTEAEFRLLNSRSH